MNMNMRNYKMMGSTPEVYTPTMVNGIGVRTRGSTMVHGIIEAQRR